MKIVQLTDCSVILERHRSLRRMAPEDLRSFTLAVGNIALSSGDRCAVVGPSGSGKSTLLELLALLRAPTGSTVRFELALSSADAPVNIERAWTSSDNRLLTSIRARYIGAVPSSGALFQSISLRQNAAYRAALADVSPEQAQIRINELARMLEIESCMSWLPGQLSRGQAMRGAILQILVHRPLLIVADEPTASLNPALATKVLSMLGDYASEYGGAVIVATHDSRAAIDNGYTLFNAETRFDGEHQFTRFA